MVLLEGRQPFGRDTGAPPAGMRALSRRLVLEEGPDRRVLREARELQQPAEVALPVADVEILELQDQEVRLGQPPRPP